MKKNFGKVDDSDSVDGIDTELIILASQGMIKWGGLTQCWLVYNPARARYYMKKAQSSQHRTNLLFNLGKKMRMHYSKKQKTIIYFACANTFLSRDKLLYERASSLQAG